MFDVVKKKSLADAVFEQLRERIISGHLKVGETLVGERELCKAFGVNRGALREALKRLEECRLVHKQQGGATRVLDFRKTGTMSLLETLLVSPATGVCLPVVRSVVEMRAVLAPDIARLAALRGRPEVFDALREIVVRMRAHEDDLLALQAAALDFWDTLVDGSDNLAYRFAFNTLREGYSLFMEHLGEAVWEEVSNMEAYTQLATAVCRGEAERAQALARELMGQSSTPILTLLQQFEKNTEGGGR